MQGRAGIRAGRDGEQHPGRGRGHLVATWLRASHGAALPPGRDGVRGERGQLARAAAAAAAARRAGAAPGGRPGLPEAPGALEPPAPGRGRLGPPERLRRVHARAQQRQRARGE